MLLGFPDVDEIPEFKAPEKAKQVQAQRQFKRAEIADAVMGTAHSPVIEHLIPKDLHESLMGEACVDEDCKAEETSISQTHESILSSVIHTDTMEIKEQNLTETSKPFKVNCDKRNITGMENFTVQVLNASQVHM